MNKDERGAEKKQALPVPYIMLGKNALPLQRGKRRNSLNIYNPKTKMTLLLYLV